METSSKEAWRDYRNRDNWGCTKSVQEDRVEPCVAYSDYGSGSYWIGKADRTAMAYVGPASEYLDDEDEDPESFDTLPEALARLSVIASELYQLLHKEDNEE